MLFHRLWLGNVSKNLLVSNDRANHRILAYISAVSSTALSPASPETAKYNSGEKAPVRGWQGNLTIPETRHM